MAEEQIKLRSSDGEVFDVELKVAQCFNVIKQMLENLGLDESDKDNVIPVPVSAAILELVIKWVEHHKDDPPPAEDDEDKESRSDEIGSWDSEFVNVEQDTLFELILAANYLDIPGLMGVTCKTVANMIKRETPDDIRKAFNIKNDFSPAELEQILRENDWCEKNN